MRARGCAQLDEARVTVGVVGGLLTLTGTLRRSVPAAAVDLGRPAAAVGTRCST